MKTELKLVKYNSEDDRFKSFSEGDILFEVLGLQEKGEGEEATKEEEEEYLVFPKGTIVQLTEGTWPLLSYLYMYRYSGQPHRIGGVEVRIEEFTYRCAKNLDGCSISILALHTGDKKEDNTDATNKEEKEKKSNPVTETECTSFLQSMGIKDNSTFRKWASKGGHPNVGGDEKLFKIVSHCVDKVIKKISGGAKRTRKHTSKKTKKQTKKQTKKRAYRIQRGGAPLATMPQLCFGTVQSGLDYALTTALTLGYRHIDGAEVYQGIHLSGYAPIDYKQTLHDVLHKFKTGANGLPRVEREQIWITWKDNQISKEKIEATIAALDCEYIDLFLVHHSCGTAADFIALQNAQAAGLIRFYGVSNCENLGRLAELKERYDIYANQIQARPPGGGVDRREILSPDFIERSTALGIHTMLFATTSGVTTTDDYSSLMDAIGNDLMMINQYYIQRFLGESNNVLMVSSQTTLTLQPNYDAVTTFLSGTPLLTDAEMNRVEKELKKIVLTHM
jgi:diketogulonate reductase-like aldo/keto reductase